MPVITEISWFTLGTLGVACVLIGAFARHLWGRQVERAAASRVAALCDQLDTKDRTLHGLRAELQQEQARAGALQAALDARHAVSALHVEENEDPAFFRRLLRAL